MVPSQEDHHLCTTSTRPTKYHSRFPIETPVRSNRLDVRPCHFSVSQSLSGSISGRPLCYQAYCSTASLFQLEARSRGGSHGCISAELVGYPGVRTPTMVPNWQSLGKGSEGGSLSDHCNTIMAYSGLVPDSVGVTGRLSNDATKGQDHFTLSQLHRNGEVRSSTTSHLEGIRERLKSKKVSNQAIDFILHSWRDKTNANYDSAWKSWEAYCQSKDTCPFLADVTDILDILAVKFHSGLAYRSLNCYRSALSSAVLPIEGFKVGQHPLVARLMKEVFNARPPRPKYADTWDVSRVLALLKSWGKNETLSLKLLTRKLAVLLALVLAHCCSDLVRLSLQGRKFSAREAELQCSELAKTAKASHMKSLQSVLIAGFDQDLALCPVKCLKAYEVTTAPFRMDNQQLFLAVVAPYKQVTSSTIARWLKETIQASGAGAEFSAHSTRGASSTAAAMSGLSVQEVMARACWSSKDTFSKHYFRPSERS